MKRPLLKYLEKLSGDDETGMYTIKGGYWQHAIYALAEFPDKKIRSVRLSQQADTFFSWPGRTSYNRHTVKCWIENKDGRIMGHYDTSSLQQHISPTGKDRK